jgi:SAM-dependent methyltransferase
MATYPDLKRYELFGWDYESVNTLTDEEVSWYEMWARRTSGPVLGLACGTGRLLCRLAEAGIDVTGVDLSDTMLSLARKNMAKLPPTARKRIRLIRADMANFDLGEQFGLVFIADNSFREQKTRRGLLSCVNCVRCHLKPGGKMLITERRFDPSLYPKGQRSFGWSQPQPHPETGELVSRRGEIRLSRNRKRISGKFIYKTTHPDGSETIEECPWSAPMLNKQEYLDLFARAGFDAQTFVGYKETPDDGKNRILCFVCEHKGDK